MRDDISERMEQYNESVPLMQDLMDNQTFLKFLAEYIPEQVRDNPSGWLPGTVSASGAARLAGVFPPLRIPAMAAGAGLVAKDIYDAWDKYNQNGGDDSGY